jgi:hypothetical protein
MHPLSSLSGRSAEWIQPKLSIPAFHLRSGEELFASLTFRSMFGTLATAQASEGSWTFKRVGFLNPRVTVRVAGAEDDLAVYHPKVWGDGNLTFASGRAFVWKPTNFWATDWAFSDVHGATLLRLMSGVEKEGLRDLLKDQATLTLLPDSAGVDEVPILACLGMYLLILHRVDTAAAVAATAGSSAA